MKTRVVHCKKEQYDIYIGRPSEYGNPFIIGKDGTRDQCIKSFERKILSDPEAVRQIRRELHGKILGCWCKPLSCHGDVLARIADEVDIRDIS